MNRLQQIPSGSRKERILNLLGGLKGHLLSLMIGGGLYLGYLLIRSSRQYTNMVLDNITTPYKRMMGALCELLPISGMELAVVGTVLAIAASLTVCIIRTIRGRNSRILIIGRTVAGLAAAALLIWDGYCWLWGLNYYGDSFSDKSGLEQLPVSTEALYQTTVYYAELANQYAGLVSRDENGIFNEDLDSIFAMSDQIYAGIVQEYPFLDAPARTPKRMIASELMSRINFTGVYFPFTSETNINDHAPSMLIPSTIAHELAHQRGIAPEQEANFVAVRACLTSGSDIYAYSGALLAYIYLGNALYEADPESWKTIYAALSDDVRADLTANNRYWEEYQTSEAKAAESVYTAFLSSYDQQLGMKSYGACVDLLVADYTEQIRAEETNYLENVSGVS